ncbi:hypothetical protein GQ55_5G097400 [Panicum hallii var. hallii]|uniref:Uncharacterized protein n=1 Tax=Panicum hallii var. hallii TaxID=1504633 RepID=A0A2T7DEL6_9POAL|nr:hypothetical protein GQ55_5G097400 [Panicum hallii var. hallii]
MPHRVGMKEPELDSSKLAKERGGGLANCYLHQRAAFAINAWAWRGARRRCGCRSAGRKATT